MKILMIILGLIWSMVHSLFASTPPQLASQSNYTAGSSVVAVAASKFEPRHIPTNLRRLPRNQAVYAVKTAGQVSVRAGDRGVSGSTVQSASQIVQDLSLPTLKNTLGLAPSQNLNIVLFSAKNTYASALRKAGVPSGSVPALVANTGGLTVGSDIWIPLYALKDKSDLADVLTHEMTHVIFNQMGIGEKLPTWLNEGTAWYEGLTAQASVNQAETLRDITAFHRDVSQAAAAGRLLPLSANEQQILSAPYNVEFEDFMAAQYLIQHYGNASFASFLRQVANEDVSQSFVSQFHISIGTYETSTYRSLM